MANTRHIYDNNGDGSEDTVYRYLCPLRKAGSIIGKGGEIAKQIRSETKANMRINEALPGCDERVVTLYSTSEETNCIGDDEEEFACPAFDALLKVHDMVVAEEVDSDGYEQTVVAARMLVASDQIGCLIGKGGQVIQKLREDTNAQIRVINDNLPLCALALSNDEVLQIVGEPLAVREALYQVASLLYDNPSRFQHYFLSSSISSLQQSGGVLMSPPPPLTNSHRNYYSAPRDVADVREFSVCFICPAENIGGVIGKGGSFINQIRQETGAVIKVNTSETDEDDDDCIIFISSKECFEDQSPTVNAALRLQTRFSERVGKDSTDSAISTRVLVPSSRVGCLIGRGGAIISEMRSVTRANIRIVQGEDVPQIAREDEEMVQITGSLDAAIKALTQVMFRLRASVFDMDRGLVLLPTFFPYISQATETSSKPRQRKRENHSHGSMEIGRNEDYGNQMMNSNSHRRNHVY
ncbi:hypothetical protein HA466_0220590 [Hirschfeldia incana]|nr:hypothetical protein HA466_0220590 [Hirschfeldia incana]